MDKINEIPVDEEDSSYSSDTVRNITSISKNKWDDDESSENVNNNNNNSSSTPSQNKKKDDDGDDENSGGTYISDTLRISNKSTPVKSLMKPESEEEEESDKEEKPSDTVKLFQTPKTKHQISFSDEKKGDDGDEPEESYVSDTVKMMTPPKFDTSLPLDDSESTNSLPKNNDDGEEDKGIVETITVMSNIKSDSPIVNMDPNKNSKFYNEVLTPSVQQSIKPDVNKECSNELLKILSERDQSNVHYSEILIKSLLQNCLNSKDPSLLAMVNIYKNNLSSSTTSTTSKGNQPIDIIQKPETLFAQLLLERWYSQK